MNKGNSPYVIAIAAVSGGGKTTITKLQNQKLPHSKALFLKTMISMVQMTFGLGR